MRSKGERREETAIFYQHRGQQPSIQGWGAVLGTSGTAGRRGHLSGRLCARHHSNAVHMASHVICPTGLQCRCHLSHFTDSNIEDQ